MGAVIEGYKIIDPDWKCRGKQYSCPGEFVEDVKPVVCECGMHFCRKLSDCLYYYPLEYAVPEPNVIPDSNIIYKTHVVKVMADSDKCVFNIDIAYGYNLPIRYVTHKYATSELRILKELTDEEIIATICQEVNHDLDALRALIRRTKAYEAVYFRESRTSRLWMVLTEMLKQQKAEGVDD